MHNTLESVIKARSAVISRGKIKLTITEPEICGGKISFTAEHKNGRKCLLEKVFDRYFYTSIDLHQIRFGIYKPNRHGISHWVNNTALQYFQSTLKNDIQKIELIITDTVDCIIQNPEMFVCKIASSSLPHMHISAGCAHIHHLHWEECVQLDSDLKNEVAELYAS